MRNFITVLFALLFLLSSCRKEQVTEPVDNNTNPDVVIVDTLNTIDSQAIAKRLIIPAPVEVWDLRAEMTRAEFEEKKGAELEMLLIRPIYSKIYDLDQNDTLVVPQLTEGQKALYFFRKMDEAMSEGGIESLYKTNIPQHLAIAAQSFRSIEIENLGTMAEKAAMDHKRINSIASPDKIQKQDPFMKNFDAEYSKNHNEFYKKLERYIRDNPEEFIKFTD